jgi:ketosteroid isomerase-like protein
MTDFQTSKDLVRRYYEELDTAAEDEINAVIRRYTSDDYHWRGMHPFHEQFSADDVASVFWRPFRRSFTSVQRRPDVFMAGLNDCDDFSSEWVCCMGHMMGLFDEDWLGIPASGKMAFLRFAEFNRIENGKIAETALFCDIIHVMQQVGLTPLPLQTGAHFVQPGPRTHAGLLYGQTDPAEGKKTLDLINQMVFDLTQDYFNSPEERLGPLLEQGHDLVRGPPALARLTRANVMSSSTRDRFVST